MLLRQISDLINSRALSEKTLIKLIGEYSRAEIIEGLHKNRDIIFYFDQERIEIVLDDNIEFEHRNQIHFKNIPIASIESFESIMSYVDNADRVGLFVGIFAWIGVAFYSVTAGYLEGGEAIAQILLSTISGVIWGGIAWIITKQIKHKVNAIRLNTSSEYYVFEFKERIFEYLKLKVKEVDSKPTKSNIQLPNSPKNNVVSDKYEELIKMKDLLDKGVITQSEFETEKKKILSK